jgi:hypothetical protein
MREKREALRRPLIHSITIQQSTVHRACVRQNKTEMSKASGLASYIPIHLHTRLLTRSFIHSFIHVANTSEHLLEDSPVSSMGERNNMNVLPQSTTIASNQNVQPRL